MTESRLDNRQSRQRDLLDQVALTTNKDLDDLLRSVNRELTPPLRLTITGTHVVNVGSLVLPNLETGRNRVIPPISNLLPFSWTAGNVTVPATNNNNITNDTGGPPVLLNIASGEYVRMGIALNSLGQLQVTLGTPNAVAASATVAAVPNNTFGVGHILLHNTAGAIDTIDETTDVYQYVGGGGGGGSGNANIIETAIRDQLLLSPYSGATPVIFEIDEDAFEDPTSTGTFSIVSSTYDITTGQKFVSKQMLDANEFLGKEKDLRCADFTIFWNADSIDENATYRITRDGGVNWETLTMNRVGDGTVAWYGTHTFAAPAVYTTLDSAAGGALVEEMNTTDHTKIAQQFSNVASGVVNEIDFDLTVNGSPLGTLCVLIAKDDGGGLPGEIISKSAIVDITGLSTGTLTVPVTDAVLIGGEIYHAIIQTDAEYKSAFIASTTSISFARHATNNGLSRQDAAGTWTDAGAEGLNFVAYGRLHDLRVEVTAVDGGGIDGFGVFYDKQLGTVITGIPNFDRKDFKAVADNDDTFAINFTPDPRLLEVYYVQAGQVFKYPSFSIRGQNIVFDANTFDNGGIEADVTLLFMQSHGSSFDNSDRNAALMAENHLGSEAGAYDLSAAGRGIKIRNAAGLLREISLDEDDNIVISSLP